MDALDLSSVTETQGFTYKSLDFSQRSIRLVRVLPTKSIQGYIQCELRHASVESEYTCLSYVWGDPSVNRVLIDGQLHFVRDNLLEFLDAVQLNSISEWLWIDAICIDQANGLERTHQVQQMSVIYSNAQGIIAWLGNDSCIAAFLRYVRRRLGIPCVLMQAFVSCSYWKRAWVTQEMFLARKVLLMAVNMHLPLEDLPDSVVAVPTTYQEDPKSWKPHYTPIWPNCFLDASLEDWRSLQGKSLVDLVLKLRRKECQESQDRVYSVLGICGEGSDLRVDYKRSNEQLALEVVLSCKASFCLCSVYEICAVLGVEVEHNSFSCPVSSNIWKHHHANVSIPLAMLDSSSSKRGIPKEIFLETSATVASSTLSGACCPQWSGSMHAHHVPPAQIGQRRKIIISIPPRSLCKSIQGGYILSAHNGLIVGHCYTRLLSGTGENELFWVSKTEIFCSIRPLAEDLRYDEISGTARFSLTLLFWLGYLYDGVSSGTGTNLKCCSAYKEGQSLLRL